MKDEMGRDKGSKGRRFKGEEGEKKQKDEG